MYPAKYYTDRECKYKPKLLTYQFAKHNNIRWCVLGKETRRKCKRTRFFVSLILQITNCLLESRYIYFIPITYSIVIIINFYTSEFRPYTPKYKLIVLYYDLTLDWPRIYLMQENVEDSKKRVFFTSSLLFYYLSACTIRTCKLYK